MPRLPHARRTLLALAASIWPPVAALLLVCAGVAVCVAWQKGLYANTAVALLAAAWVATGAFWRPPLPLVALTSEPDTAPPILALQGEVRRLGAMLDHAPAPFVTLGGDGALRAVNRAARAMFATDDLIAQPPPALADAITRAAAGDRAVLQLPVRAGDAATRSYAIAAAASLGPAGQQILTVLTDVEAELRVAEAGALRDLLQVISHEIMNSLTPVTSLVESAHALLGENPGDTAQAAAALETVLRRAQGLESFVRNYRTLARLPPPIPRPVSVATILQDSARLFETKWHPHGLTLRVGVPEPDLVARLDADLIGQALLNLLTNAAEAALSGGTQPALVCLRAYAHGSQAAFEITDSGPGVPAGEETSIFQPFFTLKPNGGGVGLWLARQIALSHGGTLSLSAEGPGACFVLMV